MGFFKNSTEEQQAEEALISLFEKLKKLLSSDEEQNKLYKPQMIEQMQVGGAVDVLPNAEGDFGRAMTNPIPVNGAFGELLYLSCLLSPSGEKIYFHRLGACDKIDIYELVSESGDFWDILYVDMYHTRKSKLVPKGYQKQPEVILIRGINFFHANFPVNFYPKLFELTNNMGLPIAETSAKRITVVPRPKEQIDRLNEVEAIIQTRWAR